MKSAVETLNPTRVRLTVEVPFEELKPSLDAAYKKIAGEVTVPGFRKGRVPPAIIDRRFGRAAVLDQAINDALPKLYSDAVQEGEIEPLGQPKVDMGEVADGEDLTFTAEVDVRPELDLPDYTTLQVSVPDVEVTDADVDADLDALRERFAQFDVVDRAAGPGDHLSIDLNATAADGSEIPDAQASGFSYEVGGEGLLAGMDEAVTGMSAGESTSFRTKLPAGPRADEEIDVHVSVVSVKQKALPEADDEFAQSASEFDTIDELRTDLREKAARRKQLDQGEQARDKVLEALLAQVEVPLPEAFLQQEIQFRYQSMEQQLQASGLTMEAYLAHEDKSAEQLAEEVAERSREAIRAQFVLDCVAKRENVEVSQDELTRHLIQRSQGSGMSPDQFAQEIVNANQVPMLVAEVVRSKALAVVLNSAAITDESGREIDLSQLRPDSEEMAAQFEQAAAEAAGPGAGELADGAGETEPAETGAAEAQVAANETVETTAEQVEPGAPGSARDTGASGLGTLPGMDQGSGGSR